MQLKFQPDLSYQLQAINSVIEIFKGQPVRNTGFALSFGDGAGIVQTDLGIGNRLLLTKDEILKNVQAVQRSNGLPASKDLEELQFSIEMETGTGKTYVYLRTIYELNRQYGFAKFVIVVPSVAIREGVYKSLQITEDHFNELYDREPLENFIYDSNRLERLAHFAAANSIQVMVMNIDAFRKGFLAPDKGEKSNIIHRENDCLNGLRPIEFIQQAKPIVIIDEPQSVDTTAKSKAAIASLNPLSVFRYSATHVDKHHLIYRLSAADAYAKGLVKKVEVISIRSEKTSKEPYIKLLDVFEQGAKVELDAKIGEKIKRTAKTVKDGELLYEISGKMEGYENYTVDQIEWGEGVKSIKVNGKTLHVGQSLGGYYEDLEKRHQIRRTIETHLDKELDLLPKGIKVLSLFFIDKVANYRIYKEGGISEKGKYAIIFEEEYNKLIQNSKYEQLKKYYGSAEKIHNGYFARDKKGRLKDTKGNTKADFDVYSLIMKEKERLLSLDEPLRFIFSHSALREGWDNPNIFQICTLKDSPGTYVSRRQEIGRGLRLAVNDLGERIADQEINKLTMIVNESYEQFVANLQKEMGEDGGLSSEKTNSVQFHVKDRDKKKRPEKNMDGHFEMKQKTGGAPGQKKRKVCFNSEELIEKAARSISKMKPIEKICITARKTTIEQMDPFSLNNENLQAAEADESFEHSVALPDIISLLQERTKLTRKTIVNILVKSKRLEDFKNNPLKFIDNVTGIINKELKKMLS